MSEELDDSLVESSINLIIDLINRLIYAVSLSAQIIAAEKGNDVYSQIIQYVQNLAYPIESKVQQELEQVYKTFEQEWNRLFKERKKD